MATLGNQRTAYNGTTTINGLDAPTGSNKREVLDVVVQNLDTVQHVFTHRWSKTAGALTVELPPLTLDAGKSGVLQGVIGLVLAATDETHKTEIEAAHTTTAPIIFTTHFEVP